MEKIQSALAKARAAREGALEAAPARPATPAVPATGLAPVGASAPAAPSAHAAAPAAAPAAAAPPEPAPRPAPDGGAKAPRPFEAAWASLVEVRLDPAALARAHVVAGGGGPEAAPFDVVRTKVLHQMRANGWRRLAVTSPGPGCGKSTVSLNLALSLARQDTVRVALCEADLRRPSLHRTLGVKREAGFAQLLEGSADLDQVALRHGTNLALLPACRPRRNPADLFQSPRAAAALDALEARLEPTLSIFDLPPMLVGDDVMAFMGYVDCVLLIAAAESTTIKEIDGCERELAARTNVMGVILNKCRYLGGDRTYAAYG